MKTLLGYSVLARAIIKYAKHDAEKEPEKYAEEVSEFMSSDYASDLFELSKYSEKYRDKKVPIRNIDISKVLTRK